MATDFMLLMLAYCYSGTFHYGMGFEKNSETESSPQGCCCPQRGVREIARLTFEGY